MADSEAIHPPFDLLTAYALGRLDGPERDEIERHLSSCDSCCRTMEDQPGDSLVLKLRARGSGAVAAECESAGAPPSGFQVPSSFVVGAGVADRPTDVGPPSGSPGMAALPQELNDHPRYRIVAAIGEGGMGAVYRAEHRLMGRTVALKVIRGDLLGSAAMVERFRGEVRAAARLASHPNIVAAHDAERAGATHMLVMEFVEGTDLAELVKRRGPLPVGEACEYIRQAALGLQHAFEGGMVHRDIKPQNLMRTTRGQVKILDFGLARFTSEAASLGGMTGEGMVLGSADYIAPEQIDDPHAADIRADIYSLGGALYFLLAGRPPFPDGSPIQKLMAHREKTPQPLAEIRAAVPPELARVVERMMARDPARRFRTPDEVAQALGPFADAEAARAAPTARIDAPTLAETSPVLTATAGDGEQGDRATGPGRRRRRTWRPIAAALAVLALGGGFLALIFPLDRRDAAIVNTPREIPRPAPGRPSGPMPGGMGETARLPSPRDPPGKAGTIVVVAPSQERGGPSLVYGWDGKSENPRLLISRKPRFVYEIHAFAVGRDGRQYYLNRNGRDLVQADRGGETKVFTHTTYVRDLALDEDDDIYFSEASGGASDGKIYRLVPATDRALARAERFYTVDVKRIAGGWGGNFAFGRDAMGRVDTHTLYLSSGNSKPAFIYRIARREGRWSDPAVVFESSESIWGLVFTAPTEAYYADGNKVFRLTSTGLKVAFTVPDVSAVFHVSVVPDGAWIKSGGDGGPTP